MTFWQKWNKDKKTARIPFWAAGAGLGIVFLIIGFYEEQFTDLYRKAVMICLECIGIG